LANHDAFMRAICEEPDEVAHRLVYADWLEDHHDPERAEFIRLQCELARWETQRAEVAALEDRAYDLLECQRSTWEAPLTSIPPFWSREWSLHFRRGFVEVVYLPASVFVQYGRALAERTPLRGWVATSLRCRWSETLEFADLLGGAALGCLSELDLGYLDLQGENLRALGQCDRLKGLRTLSLGRGRTVPYPGRYNVATMQTLAHAPVLAQVTSLNLAGQRLGPASVEAVAGSPMREVLVKLDWSRNRAQDAGAALLAERFTALQVLRLGNNRLTALGLESFPRAIFAPHLVILDLGNRPGESRANLIGNQGMVALSRSRFPNLRALHLARNQIGDEGMKALASAPHLPSLRVLDLAGNQLRRGATWALAASPLRNRVVELDLSDNHLGDRALDVFFDLPWPCLRRLALHGNPIGDNRLRQLHAHLSKQLVGGSSRR
jgi:uncharacterized protein (TIGR02996 family)